ncbi:MAG: hypothetical protein ACKN9V_07085 [Pseudomonadota bacterium]
MRRLFTLVFFLTLTLVSCKTPEKAYFQTIQNLGVIPFRNPVSALATGTPLRGQPGNVIAIAPPTRCFPNKYKGKPTNLRWVSDIIIPPSYKKMMFTFDAKLNSLMAVGTPGLQFNLTGTKVQTVELDIEEAQIEMIDQLSLKEIYGAGMSESCKEMLASYPFILEALRVNKMSFTFFDSFGGKMEISSANIGDFALFGGEVQWYIEQGSKLVVVTPKYIGYKLAQLRSEDEGFVNLTASEVSKQKGQYEYVWKSGIPEDNQGEPAGLFRGDFQLGLRKRITTTTD